MVLLLTSLSYQYLKISLVHIKNQSVWNVTTLKSKLALIHTNYQNSKFKNNWCKDQHFRVLLYQSLCGENTKKKLWIYLLPDTTFRHACVGGNHEGIPAQECEGHTGAEELEPVHSFFLSLFLSEPFVVELMYRNVIHPQCSIEFNFESIKTDKF